MSVVDGPGLEPGVITGTGKWVFCNVQNAQSENMQTHTKVDGFIKFKVTTNVYMPVQVKWT